MQIVRIFVCFWPDQESGGESNRRPVVFFETPSGEKLSFALQQTAQDEILAYLATLQVNQLEQLKTKVLMANIAGRVTKNPFSDFNKAGTADHFAALLTLEETPTFGPSGEFFAFKTMDGRISASVPIDSDFKELVEEYLQYAMLSRSLRTWRQFPSHLRRWRELSARFEFCNQAGILRHPEWRLFNLPLRSSLEEGAPIQLESPQSRLESAYEPARIKFEGLRRGWHFLLVAIAVVFSSIVMLCAAFAFFLIGSSRPAQIHRRSLIGWTSETHLDMLKANAANFAYSLDRAGDRQTPGFSFGFPDPIETRDAYLQLLKMSKGLDKAEHPTVWAASSDLLVQSLEAEVNAPFSLTRTDDKFLVYDSEPMVFLLRRKAPELKEILQSNTPLRLLTKFNRNPGDGLTRKQTYTYSSPGLTRAGAGSLTMLFLLENWALDEGISSGDQILGALSGPKGKVSFMNYLRKLKELGLKDAYRPYPGTVAFVNAYIDGSIDCDFIMVYEKTAKWAVEQMKKKHPSADPDIVYPSSDLGPFARFSVVVLGKAFGANQDEVNAGRKFIKFLRDTVGTHNVPLSKMETPHPAALSAAIQCVEEVESSTVQPTSKQ